MPPTPVCLFLLDGPLQSTHCLPAPSAIFIAVIGTGLIGWLLNIVVVLCSGPL